MRLPVLAFAALLAATPASAFLASNGLVVRASGAGDFTIPFRGGNGAATDFWCAAGEYVTRGLGLPGSTRVFRTSPPPRRSGEGVSFSLNAARATDPGIVLLGSPDRGLTASHARQLCGSNRQNRR
jgi:hypothetical protein